MSLISVTTTDTAEARTGRAVPGGSYDGDGYDYMESLTLGGWHSIPLWGIDGWDLGAWPYVIVAATEVDVDGCTTYGTLHYCEGDVTAKWFVTPAALREEISRLAHSYWKIGQAHGPEDLPEKFQDVPERYRRAPQF